MKKVLLSAFLFLIASFCRKRSSRKTRICKISRYGKYINVIMSKGYDWTGYTISMAAGSLSLCTGLFSLLLAGRDVQTAHTNYNLYVMGIPIK